MGEGWRTKLPDFVTEVCSFHGQATALNLKHSIILIFKIGLIAYML